MSAILARGTLFYLAAVNTTSAGVFLYDKYQASHNGWRVSEKRLCQTALIGGWLGGLAAMHLFHHKTRKRSFQQKYVHAIGQNAIFAAPALLVVSGVPSLRNGFATVIRGFAAGRTPPRNPPRFRRARMLQAGEAITIIGATDVLSALNTLIGNTQALRNGKHICEKHFRVFTLCGGWPGAIFAVCLFRHKTMKQSFHIMYGFSVVINIYIVLLYFLRMLYRFAQVFGR